MSNVACNAASNIRRPLKFRSRWHRKSSKIRAIRGANTRPTLREWANLFAWKSTWRILLGFMGVIYVIWMYLTWLRAFISQQYHVSLTKTGWLVAILYVFAIASSVSSGYISDYLIRRGHSPIFAWKVLVALGLILPGLCAIPAAYADTAMQAVMYVSVAQFFVQIASGSSWILAKPSIVARGDPKFLRLSCGFVCTGDDGPYRRSDWHISDSVWCGRCRRGLCSVCALLSCRNTHRSL